MASDTIGWARRKCRGGMLGLRGKSAAEELAGGKSLNNRNNALASGAKKPRQKCRESGLHAVHVGSGFAAARGYQSCRMGGGCE